MCSIIYLSHSYFARYFCWSKWSIYVLWQQNMFSVHVSLEKYWLYTIFFKFWLYVLLSDTSFLSLRNNLLYFLIQIHYLFSSEEQTGGNKISWLFNGVPHFSLLLGTELNIVMKINYLFYVKHIFLMFMIWCVNIFVDFLVVDFCFFCISGGVSWKASQAWVHSY